MQIEQLDKITINRINKGRYLWTKEGASWLLNGYREKVGEFEQ